MTREGVATVAGQEFRLRVRAGRWQWLLGVWVVLLLVITAGLRAVAGQVDDLADDGTIVYGGLVLLVLGLALLVVPSLAAQSVNGDRERGTLAALQVTLLSPGEIALGKLAAAWGTALLFVALSLPMSLYAVTQGGVTLGRLLVVYAVLALLVGTVCAVALWLSAVLARTTTSGLLAYGFVAVLTVGTLLAFALASALTVEEYTETSPELTCSDGSYPTGVWDPASPPPGCTSTSTTYTSSRSRTERTWWLLAPNPFAVLADAAPGLPGDPPGLSEREQRARDQRRQADPLGQLGSATRALRQRPDPLPQVYSGAAYSSTLSVARDATSRRLVWPYGLAFDAALGAGAVLLTARRLRTPSRTLPRGQRVA